MYITGSLDGVPYFNDDFLHITIIIVFFTKKTFRSLRAWN